MARAKKTADINEAAAPADAPASPEVMTAYIVKTIMGYVNVPADKVEGKTDEELTEWLNADDYLSRLGAHAVVKVTHETLFTRTV